MIEITIECLQRINLSANQCMKIAVGAGKKAATASCDHAFPLRGISIIDFASPTSSPLHHLHPSSTRHNKDGGIISHLILGFRQLVTR
jgi:hypothetical protein